MKFITKLLALVASSLILGSCGGGGGGGSGTSAGASGSETPGDVFVLTSDNKLVSFDRTNPSVIRTSVPITGIQSGDTLIGMDFYPRRKELYLLARTSPGNGARVYTVNTSNGTATAGTTLIRSPSNPGFGTPGFSTLDPAATVFGASFAPGGIGNLKITSNTGQNLSAYVTNETFRMPGETTLDSQPSTQLSGIAGVAHTNSFWGTTNTRQLNINTVDDTLTSVSTASNSQTILAPLGVDATGTVGFDIDPRTNQGYALLNVGGQVVFHTIAIPDSEAPLPISGPAAVALSRVNIPGFIAMAFAPVASPVGIALDGNTAGTQRLLIFDLTKPAFATATPVTGMPAGERLLSIDIRPSKSSLYGLSSAGKLYSINTDSGVATLASTLSVSNEIVNGLAAGKTYDIDFNPVTDALRIVGSNEGDNVSKNYRIPSENLESNGATLTDPNLSFSFSTVGTPSSSPTNFNVKQIAHTNSVNPAPDSTRLINIDTLNRRVLYQDANSGVMALNTSLHTNSVDLQGTVAFDIAGGDNGLPLFITLHPSFNIFELRYASIRSSSAAAYNVVLSTVGSIEIGSASFTTATDIRSFSIRF